MSNNQKLMPWSKREVQIFQCALVLLGYEPNCDGEIGENTYRDLKKFQKEYGLEVTGLFDRPTVDKLLRCKLPPLLVALEENISSFLDHRFNIGDSDAKE